MNNLEASLIRSFAEVRKEISSLKDEISSVRVEISKLNERTVKRK